MSRVCCDLQFCKKDFSFVTINWLRVGVIALFLNSTTDCGAERATDSASERDPIEGIWTGTIKAPQGTVAEIGLDFFRTKRGTLVFKLNFPDMAAYAVPFMIPVETAGNGHYAITPNFNIVLDLAGDHLTGTFGLAKLPLELKRGGEFKLKPPLPSYPSAPALSWKFHLGSGTWAPPVVAGDTIYIGTDAGLFHAVRATDGSAIWTWPGTAGIDGRAVVGTDLVYVVDTKMVLRALNRSNGSLRWSAPLHDEAIAGKPAPENPTFNHRAATPLLLDDVIYCGSSDGVLSFEAKTGTRLWRHDAKAPIYSGIGILGGDTLLFGTMDGSAVLLDRRNQKEILRVKTGGSVVTTPLVVGDRLIVGSRDYQLYGFNASDGTVAWKYSYWFSWVESTPVAVDGVVYVGASDYARVSALDPATGATRWSTPVKGLNWGTPLVTSHRVFTGTVAQNIPGTAIEHSGGIIAMDRDTGKVRWQMKATAPPENGFGGYAGSLALAGDKIIAAGFDGVLIALPVD